MNATRDLNWHERQFVALVVGGLPSFFLGWFAAFGLSDHLLRAVDVLEVLRGGLWCGLFPMGVACLWPKFWLGPTLAFLSGLILAANVLQSAGTSVLGVVNWAGVTLSPVVAERWEPIAAVSSSSQTLCWMAAIALWLGGGVSLLRINTKQGNWLRRWQAWMEE